MTRPLTALIMAGGTGGHIFPGLAVADALRERGWQVHWLGGKGRVGLPSMESQWVPARGFAFEAIDFSGVRGKGLLTLALLPLRLLQAFWQSLQVVRRVKPDVVIGLGGYVSFPGGMMAVLLGKPLILHEQNSIAGMANRCLQKGRVGWQPFAQSFHPTSGTCPALRWSQRSAQAAGGGRQLGRSGAQ
jgi:UDP-N-acetylglucosamine--N-acetylmuramyl-(pentapeptide) pyrophosphoryl-undecaprenol N-acetylglucosamine transferase